MQNKYQIDSAPQSGVALNRKTLFASLPCPSSSIPSKVPWHINIQQSCRKLICLAEVKKGSESCSGRRLENPVQVTAVLEVDPLSIFKVNAQLHHIGESLVDRKSQNPPDCLIAADVAARLVDVHLIQTVFFHLEYRLVAALVNVFANVLDGPDRVAPLNIYVSLEHFQKQGVVRYDPAIVNVQFLLSLSRTLPDFCCKTSVIRLSTPIERVAIVTSLGLLDQTSRISGWQKEPAWTGPK